MQFLSCIISEHKQDTKEWLDDRVGYITGTCGYYILNPKGNYDEYFKKLALYINGKITHEEFENRKLTEKDLKLMNHGKRYEKKVRAAYKNKIESTHNLIECGFAKYKHQDHVGVSVDGLAIPIGQDSSIQKPFIIEIKCPEKIYPNLALKYDKPDHKFVYNHIKESHYIQMQHGMGVFGVEYCDYIVYSKEEERIIIERVKFDPSYWKFLLEAYMIFTKTYLDTIL